MDLSSSPFFTYLDDCLTYASSSRQPLEIPIFTSIWYIILLFWAPSAMSSLMVSIHATGAKTSPWSTPCFFRPNLSFPYKHILPSSLWCSGGVVSGIPRAVSSDNFNFFFHSLLQLCFLNTSSYVSNHTWDKIVYTRLLSPSVLSPSVLLLGIVFPLELLLKNYLHLSLLQV